MLWIVEYNMPVALREAIVFVFVDELSLRIMKARD